MTIQEFTFCEAVCFLTRRKNNEYSQLEKFVSLSAWRNAKSFTVYLLNKVQTKKD